MAFRILIVEDDEEISDFLVRGLREEGNSVELAADFDEGWHWIEKGGRWDAILLDWSLPGRDGLSLLRRLREVDERTPVVFLTAHDAVSDRVKGLDAGANDYLCKPFAFEELLARLRVVTREYDQRRDSFLSYNDLRLDLVSQRVDRGGAPLDLTAKEYALLSFLMRHSQRVLTRASIYENVWGEQFDGFSNTLEVHISELRRKLEEHGPRMIFTLRNRGYVFGEPL